MSKEAKLIRGLPDFRAQQNKIAIQHLSCQDSAITGLQSVIDIHAGSFRNIWFEAHEKLAISPTFDQNSPESNKGGFHAIDTTTRDQHRAKNTRRQYGTITSGGCERLQRRDATMRARACFYDHALALP